MLCYYGANDHWIDVTAAVRMYFQIENKLIFPAGPKSFNQYFTDPVEGYVKQLILHFSGESRVIDENDHQLHEYPISQLDMISWSEPIFEDASTIQILKAICTVGESIDPRSDI